MRSILESVVFGIKVIVWLFSLGVTGLALGWVMALLG